MNQDILEIFNQTSENVPYAPGELSRLIDLIQQHEKRNFHRVEVVFVDDEEILQINRKYLHHDYVTDIITFPYHDNDDPVEGTLFCCMQQIQRQSREFNTRFETEVLRVVTHGLLHLVGYDDATDSQRGHMHDLENKYIKLYLDN